MDDITRRGFLKLGGAVAASAAVPEIQSAEIAPLPTRLVLKDNWHIQSAALVSKSGEALSGAGLDLAGWYKASVPCTVLTALVRNGVYPDPRVGLNCYQIPDSSDEFNARYNLARFSHLPDKRNPWKEPYWYVSEFELPQAGAGR